MPEFCHQCGTMVADGTPRCPDCGARLQPHIMDKRTGFTWEDYFNYSCFTVAFLVGIVTVGVIFILACLYLPLLLGR